MLFFDLLKMLWTEVTLILFIMSDISLSEVKLFKCLISFFLDFDCDGIGCAVIAKWTYNKLNYPVTIKIPKRSEGYGISKKWINENKDTVDLVVTGDNGASKIEEVELKQIIKDIKTQINFFGWIMH